jgi:hypothetical protein
MPGAQASSSISDERGRKRAKLQPAGHEDLLTDVPEYQGEMLVDTVVVEKETERHRRQMEEERRI